MTKRIIEKIKIKIRGSLDLETLRKNGLKIGLNFNAMEGTIIDPGHCWLINIGDNVTMAPRCHILAHDASMKKSLGFTKIGIVSIGNNVFFGAGTIVLPNVRIDDNTIIGAGSVVTHSLLGGGVFAGNPVKKIYEYDEWISKELESMKEAPTFDETFRLGNITNEQRSQMLDKLREKKIGYII